MEIDGDADLQQALALSMQVSQRIAPAFEAYRVNMGLYQQVSHKPLF